MNKYLIGSAALLFGMTCALGWALYGQVQDNGKLRAKLATASNELEAERLAAKLDNQEALANYEAASASCRQSIRAAVSAAQLPKIEVPRYDETGNPNPACPAISLSDIQAAGRDAKLPAVDNGGN